MRYIVIGFGAPIWHSFECTYFVLRTALLETHVGTNMQMYCVHLYTRISISFLLQSLASIQSQAKFLIETINSLEYEFSHMKIPFEYCTKICKYYPQYLFLQS